MIRYLIPNVVQLPRLPLRSGTGSVFGANITGNTNSTDYRDRFRKTASSGLLDEEYSLLNFHTARILEKKAQILPAAILCFLTGILTALPHHLINS